MSGREVFLYRIHGIAKPVKVWHHEREPNVVTGRPISCLECGYTTAVYLVLRQMAFYGVSCSCAPVA